MSSSTFSTELTPEPHLRLFVLVTGALAAVLGAMMVAATSIPIPWRLIASLLWFVFGVEEVVALSRAYERFGRLRIDQDGTVHVLARDGTWRPARLCDGSVVLKQRAWLRVVVADGTRYGEWLRGHTAENEGWRRLQVIWRHLGAGR